MKKEKTMPVFFAMGAVAGWLLVSLFAGHLMPLFSISTIITVVIGGVVGQIIGYAAAGVGKHKSQSPNTKKR